MPRRILDKTAWAVAPSIRMTSSLWRKIIENLFWKTFVPATLLSEMFQ
jgi:hypothetical protein